MNPRLTKMRLPNRGGISSETLNLFCNQVLVNIRHLFAKFNQHRENIGNNLQHALTGQEEKIEKTLGENTFFYEDLNKIYNRGYVIEKKANEILRSIQ